MGPPLFLVDAFAERPFTGNPAAVCLLAAPADDGWLRAVARELDYPATSFVWPTAGGFGLRWLTATTELVLCGHGTLAAAHVLWEAGHLQPNEPARFETRGGPLTAAQTDGWVELDFPAEPAEPVAEAPEALLRALGVEPRLVAKSRLDYLVEVDSEAVVRDLRPDLAELLTVPTRGVIVTARSASADYDIVSRFFAPSAGIDEDAVTGSAHCTLGPFWRDRLGKDRLVAYQASARGGVVRVQVVGQRVLLRGRAITVLRGELTV